MLRQSGLIFEWDQAKSDKNLAERGFDFEYACRIFDGDVIEWDDTRRDYGERRLIGIGEIDEEVYVIVYTPREQVRRIISARPAFKEGARCPPQSVHKPRFLRTGGA